MPCSSACSNMAENFRYQRACCHFGVPYNAAAPKGPAFWFLKLLCFGFGFGLHVNKKKTAEHRFFGKNFRSALFIWQNGVVVFKQTTRSRPRPRLGLMVRCGDLTLQIKTCLFVRFFTCSQNTKMAPFSLIPKVCGHV